MVDDSVYKELFLKDSLEKQVKIEFDGGEITNTELHYEDMEINENLCSGETLRFGACEAATIKFEVSNIFTPLMGKWLDVSMTVEGANSPFSIGRYKVASDVPTADRKYRDVVAYDVMYDILNADVAEWYKSILPEDDSEVTLKDFRDSFFRWFHVEQEAVELPNDSMTVRKTVEPEEISGATVITSICEINGCFGHIGRNGKFQYIFLKEMDVGLYPADDLYPSDTLYPRDPAQVDIVGKSFYISAQYEDFETEKIDKLQIRQEENDIGVIYGEGDNAYIVQDNFLVYGMGSDELRVVAENLYLKIARVWYRPAHVEAKGNFCREVGDGIELSTKYAIIYTYILKRTIRGIQALRDTYDANGQQFQADKVTSLHESIIQLKGKSNVLTRTIEETRSEITDMERGLSSRITQTAEMIQTEVTRATEAEGTLSSRITQTAESITAEVTRATEAEGNLSSRITQTAESITSEVSRAKQAEESLGNSITTTSESLSSQITQTATQIRSEVSATYSTKTETTNAANAAVESANSNTNELLKSYSTTTEMNSAITQSANSIISTVQSTYATQSSVTTLREEAMTSDQLHYLATSASSGVTKNTSGWTTYAQSVTSTKRYLWTYHTYTYGDGTTSDSTPVITGVYGDTGNDGGKGDTGTGISEVVPLYYVSSSSTVPSAPTSNVTRTSTAKGVWTRGIPELTDTYKYMYTCDQVKYTDGTYKWTTPVLNNAVTDLSTRMYKAESSIEQNSESIALKVSKTDYDGETIASLINQSASTIQIEASHINLNGVVTANNTFKIDTSGSMTATGGSIAGFEISSTKLESWKTGSSYTYHTGMNKYSGSSNAVAFYTGEVTSYQAGDFYVRENGYVFSSNSADFAGNVAAKELYARSYGGNIGVAIGIGNPSGVSYGWADFYYGGSVKGHLHADSEDFNVRAESTVYVRLSGKGIKLINDTVYYGTLTANSSRRYKENIASITEKDADKISSLRPVEFDYKETGRHAYGLIAEETYDYLPQVVQLDDDERPDRIDYISLIPFMIKKMQMMEEEIKALKQEKTEGV